MDTAERDLLRSSLRRLLTETDAAKRSLALAEFGWFDLLTAEPHEAVPALFELQGETLATSPVLGAVIASAIREKAAADGAVAVLLPGPGTGADPASVLDGGVLQIDASTLGGGAEVDGHPPGGADGGDRLLVPARRQGEVVLAAVDGWGSLRRQRIEGIDPGLDLVHVSGRVEVHDVACGPAAVSGWERGVAAGRRALAHELIGASRSMLRLAVEHARERSQFGRRIGSFQAVQHRLAEAQVALTAAEAAAVEAWTGPEALSALLAKLWAGRAGRLVGKQAQQTLGGMGFTWEHEFHRFFRRVLALDSLLGSAPELTAEIGRHIAATGDVPRLASL